MDARELTKKYYDLRHEYDVTKKQVDYLTMECEKLRLLVDDMQVEIRMLERLRS